MYIKIIITSDISIIIYNFFTMQFGTHDFTSKYNLKRKQKSAFCNFLQCTPFKKQIILIYLET